MDKWSGQLTFGLWRWCTSQNFVLSSSFSDRCNWLKQSSVIKNSIHPVIYQSSTSAVDTLVSWHVPLDGCFCFTKRDPFNQVTLFTTSEIQRFLYFVHHFVCFSDCICAWTSHTRASRFSIRLSLVISLGILLSKAWCKRHLELLHLIQSRLSILWRFLSTPLFAIIIDHALCLKC